MAFKNINVLYLKEFLFFQVFEQNIQGNCKKQIKILLGEQ